MNSTPQSHIKSTFPDEYIYSTNPNTMPNHNIFTQASNNNYLQSMPDDYNLLTQAKLNSIQYTETENMRLQTELINYRNYILSLQNEMGKMNQRIIKIQSNPISVDNCESRKASTPRSNKEDKDRIESRNRKNRDEVSSHRRNKEDKVQEHRTEYRNRKDRDDEHSYISMNKDKDRDRDCTERNERPK